MNDLLLWISAKRAGSVQSFRGKATELDPGAAASSVAKHRLAEWNLSRLGHAEFGPAADGAEWRVAPPVLAAGDFHGPCRAVLCGARTPALVARLAASAEPGQIHVHPQSAGPDIIEAAASDAPGLARIAARAGIPIQWNASLALLAACTPPKAEVLEQAALPIGGWSVARFSRSQLAWAESSARDAAAARSGLFRFKADYATAYILIEDGLPWSCDSSQAKFRILGRRSRALAYDITAKAFMARSSCRPPALVERALVVCSGQVPTLRDGHFVYSRVERHVAAAAAALLGQRLN